MTFRQLQSRVTRGLLNRQPCYYKTCVRLTSQHSPNREDISPVTTPEIDGDKIPFKGDYSRQKCDLRREWVEQYAGVSLKNISQWWADDYSPEILKGNMELPIGNISIPVAAIGPLQINGKYANGKFLAPFPTTEGALTASIHRGAKVLNECGGVDAFTSRKTMSRCPVFKTGSPEEAVALGDWLRTKIQDIQEQVISKHSQHGKLKDIITAYDFESVHTLFIYETGDAAGHNMASYLTWKAMQWINKQMPEDITVSKQWIESILSGDKRCSHFNAIYGRGLSCGAKTIIPEHILNNRLQTNSETILQHYDILAGAANRSAAMGCNGNVANVIAALFAATGQDLANIVDSSMAYLKINPNNGPEGGIKVALWIPSLVIGTVGGGTNLPTQKECLELMGCQGNGKVRKLGEIIAAYSLALEMSTFAAASAGQLAEAHEKMGKNRPM